MEAEIGFSRPSDLERFADALAERIAELAAEFGPGERNVPSADRRPPGMSMDKPFRVEVTVDAPRDVVWRELTEPERVRHWFGWEYDGLDEEIKVIFEEHAKLLPPDRIEMSMDGLIELDEPRSADADPRDQAG